SHVAQAARAIRVRGHAVDELVGKLRERACVDPKSFETRSGKRDLESRRRPRFGCEYRGHRRSSKPRSCGLRIGYLQQDEHRLGETAVPGPHDALDVITEIEARSRWHGPGVRPGQSRLSHSFASR